jgi:hypothetical protein
MRSSSAWDGGPSHALSLVSVLKLIAPGFLLVGVLHLVLGVRANVLLGARPPVDALADSALDSQNRLYGVAFSLHGVLLYLCATDLPRYATVSSSGSLQTSRLAARRLPSAVISDGPPNDWH